MDIGQQPGGAGTSDIATTLKIANQNMSQLIQKVAALTTALEAVLPYVQTTASSATAGAATLPANPLGFFVMTNPVSGTTVKVPYYNT